MSARPCGVACPFPHPLGDTECIRTHPHKGSHQDTDGRMWTQGDDDSQRQLDMNDPGDLRAAAELVYVFSVAHNVYGDGIAKPGHEWTRRKTASNAPYGRRDMGTLGITELAVILATAAGVYWRWRHE